MCIGPWNDPKILIGPLFLNYNNMIMRRMKVEAEKIKESKNSCMP